MTVKMAMQETLQRERDVVQKIEAQIASKGIPDCKPVKPKGGTLDFKLRG